MIQKGFLPEQAACPFLSESASCCWDASSEQSAGNPHAGLR